MAFTVKIRATLPPLIFTPIKPYETKKYIKKTTPKKYVCPLCDRPFKLMKSMYQHKKECQ